MNASSANALTDPDQYRKVLVLYLKRPRVKVCLSDAVCGRFRYSDLKEAALRDYGICMWLIRF